MSKSKVARSGKRNTMPAPREAEPASETRMKAAPAATVDETLGLCVSCQGKRVAAAAAPVATSSCCYRRTGDLDVDVFTYGRAEAASCAALFQAMLAPNGMLAPLPFAEDALRQLSCDLAVLQCAFETPEGPPNHDVMRRVITALGKRARVAAEVVVRLNTEHHSRQLNSEAAK